MVVTIVVVAATVVIVVVVVVVAVVTVVVIQHFKYRIWSRIEIASSSQHQRQLIKKLFIIAKEQQMECSSRQPDFILKKT